MLDVLTWEPNVKMQYELVLMLLLFLLPAAFLRNRKTIAKCWAALFALFLFLHRALLPFLLSGLYLYLLCGLLFMFYRLRLSAFSEPGRRLLRELSVYLGRDRESEETGESGRGILFLTAVILIVLLIQLCRINIAVDYDSLRYGLRSPYVLLGGRGLSGFFENPGLVNTVYTYSKGFELLTLPLSFFKSYAYVLCVNVWALIGVLLLCGKLVRALCGIRFSEVPAAFSAALMAGITNMAVTAKSDLPTLLCQLLFIYAVLRFLKNDAAAAAEAEEWEQTEKRERKQSARKVRAASYVGAGLFGLIASYALKPTAMLFSSVIGLTALWYILYLRRKEKSERKRPEGAASGRPETVRETVYPLRLNGASVRLISASALFTGVCWLRTLLITGLPVTSVFSGLFSAIGFQLNYPFAAQYVPDNAAALSFTESVKNFLLRLFRFLLCPLGEDMEHVLMAWGGIAFLALLLFLLLRGGRVYAYLKEEAAGNRIKKRAALSEDDASEETLIGFRFLILCFSAVLLLALASFWFLYQIDGNYYMLLYALAAVCGTAALLFSEKRRAERTEARAQASAEPLASRAAEAAEAANERRAGGPRRHGRHLLMRIDESLRENSTGLILLTAVMLYVTAFTGWAGAVGFTEIPLKYTENGFSFGNFLFYDHEKEAEARHRSEGTYYLWSELNETEVGAENHVIAFSDEPECYDFRCVTESYTDVAGSGGNVYLVKTLNIFKEFLDWSGTDYIYADKEWLSRPGNERAKELLLDLIEDGTLTDITYEADAAAGRSERGYVSETNGRYFYGMIDKNRVKEPWEVPLSAEASERAERNMQKYEEQ